VTIVIERFLPGSLGVRGTGIFLLGMRGAVKENLSMLVWLFCRSMGEKLKLTRRLGRAFVLGAGWVHFGPCIDRM
jgi:hypothetical protein